MRKKILSRFSFLLMATMIGTMLSSTTTIKAGNLPKAQLQTTQSSHRLFGSDRYATSIAISQKGWTTSDTVILASGVDYPDALCAGPLAKKYKAPILLSSKLSVSAATLNEISRLKATKVIIIGGTGAISANVQAQVEALSGITATRIGGVDRYETSALIAAQLDKPTSAVIASGNNFPDALSVSAIASNLGYPILLSNKSGLTNEMKKYITDMGITKTYVIGGTGVLDSIVESQVPNSTRLSGKDRYETNLAVLKAFEGKLNYDNVYLATGNSFADALSGAVLAANTSSPIILTGAVISEDVNSYLKGKVTLNTKVIAIGGEAVVKSSLVSTVTDDKASIAVAKKYDVAGIVTGGTVSGSAIISATGVILKDATISGDLLIASTVGEGTVTLDNVKVAGKIIVNGGGAKGVEFKNTKVQNVVLDKANGTNVGIITDKASSIATVTAESNSIVDETLAAKPGNIIVSGGSDITLAGAFDKVQVTGNSSNVGLLSGSIATLEIGATASDTKVDIAKAASIAILNVSSPVAVTGKGSIEIANIGVNGSTIETAPIATKVVAGVTATVGGQVKNDVNTPVIPSVPASLDTTTPPVTPPIDNGGGSSTVAVSGITNSRQTMTLSTTTTSGAIGIITATITPSNATNKGVTWSSDKTAVATVVNGVVTAKAAGTAIIKATATADGTKFATTVVTVAVASQVSAMAVNLGEAGKYAILSKTGISSVPASIIKGDIGVSPISHTAITGFSETMHSTNVFSTSKQVTGNIYAADYTSPTPSNLTTAISNMETAYTDAAGRAPNYTELYSGDISGKTLAAGVYKWGTDVLINTDVTLNGGANDIWIFQIDKGITQAAGAKIILSGGALAKNIFWQVAENVAIGANGHFEGIIMGKKIIALDTNASINGRLLAQTAVTLIKNTVTAPVGVAVTTTSTASTLTSTIGTVVNTAGTIVAIPKTTTLAAFKAAITPAVGATFQVYQADGITIATDLKSTYKVIVTAQDGTTKKTYIVTLLP